MAEVRTLRTPNPNHAKNNYLRSYAKNVHSQMGEDGIIAELFHRIKASNKWCVEFGAWDGVYLSNACRLIREDEWSAVLIEGNEERAAQITHNYPGNDRVHAVQAFVGLQHGQNSIDDILSRSPIPKDFDLISIDVDGNDYHIWKSITAYRPRVVACEFNPMIPNEVIFIQDANPSINEGNSLAALIELGKAKNYELVCVSHSNAFFIVSEEYARLEIADNSINAMWPSPPHFIWSCYNGKIYHSMPTMKWGGRFAEGFGPESLQYLSRFGFHGRSQGSSDSAQRNIDQLRSSLAEAISALEAYGSGRDADGNAHDIIARARDII